MLQIIKGIQTCAAEWAVCSREAISDSLPAICPCNTLRCSALFMAAVSYRNLLIRSITRVKYKLEIPSIFPSTLITTAVAPTFPVLLVAGRNFRKILFLHVLPSGWVRRHLALSTAKKRFKFHQLFHKYSLIRRSETWNFHVSMSTQPNSRTSDDGTENAPTCPTCATVVKIFRVTEEIYFQIIVKAVTFVKYFKVDKSNPTFGKIYKSAKNFQCKIKEPANFNKLNFYHFFVYNF